MTIDILFTADLFVNFISAYEIGNNVVEVRLRYCIWNYLKSWFFFDVLACIPTQLIEELQAAGDYKSLMRLARLPRLYRLLRILRLFKMVRIIKYNKMFTKIQEALKMNAGISRMISVMVSVFFMVHLMSCFWFLTAKMSDFEPDTWVVRINMVDSDPFE
jgi:hypothetical protein